jgi:predicted PurR-regulated permease PerM
VSARKLLVRQAVIAVIVGVVIYLSRGIAAGIGYGLAFYVISTPLAIWVERRRARHDLEA